MKNKSEMNIIELISTAQVAGRWRKGSTGDG